MKNKELSMDDKKKNNKKSAKRLGKD